MLKCVISVLDFPVRVRLELMQRPSTCEVHCDVLADLNEKGNWVRGFELLGSSGGVSLLNALEPHIRHAPGDATDNARVTYDEQANAGFIYLPPIYNVGARLRKPFQTIEDEAGILGLDHDGILTHVTFALPRGTSVDRFLEMYSQYKK